MCKCENALSFGSIFVFWNSSRLKAVAGIHDFSFIPSD